MAGSADSVKETLAEPASLEQVIKNSRFLARAWPIGNIEEAEQQIAEITIHDKNGGKIHYKIDVFNTDIGVDDDDFVFRPEDHPDVEVVDMR